jgi:aldehyde:ferredoxin oxidoreductase
MKRGTQVMHFAYAGKILDLNLSTKSWLEKSLDLSTAREFLGGLGLGVKILYDEVGPNIDPLSPENLIIIVTGPLTGTAAPTSGRTEIVTKSPLTGSIGTGNFGGAWGLKLKRAGFDALVVRGASDTPVYLLVEDDRIELQSAEDLWGKDSWETTDILRKELKDYLSVLAIGQAGENLVRFACPVADYYHAPGRSHAGCVMGSKKLKAIAVGGKKGKVGIADPEVFDRVIKEIRERIALFPESKARGKTGSNYLNKTAADHGVLPSKNFQTGVIPLDSEVRNFPQSVEENTKMGPDYCFACSMSQYYGCNLITHITKGPYAGVKVSGISFSYDGWGWGANCGIKSFPAMWKCRELCQRYGLDLTGPIPFAMELFQRGILSQEDTDGVDLDWGNERAVMEMLRKIAYREGLGDILAEGSANAAKRIGKGAEKYALTIKGKELQRFDPRMGGLGKSLGMIVGPRGDDLNTTHGISETFPDWAKNLEWNKEQYLRWFVNWLDMFEEVKKEIYGDPPRPEALDGNRTQGKAALIKWFGEITTVIDSLDLCLFAANTFAAMGPTHFAKLYSASTGYPITPREIMKAAEKIFNLMKAYIVREGFTRKDDDWPARFYEEPVPEGLVKGNKLSREKMNQLLDEYYEAMGWDKESGLPTGEKLRDLNLGKVADELERLGKLPNSGTGK